jgi:hypothetical protein
MLVLDFWDYDASLQLGIMMLVGIMILPSTLAVALLCERHHGKSIKIDKMRHHGEVAKWRQDWRDCRRRGRKMVAGLTEICNELSRLSNDLSSVVFSHGEIDFYIYRLKQSLF